MNSLSIIVVLAMVVSCVLPSWATAGTPLTPKQLSDLKATGRAIIVPQHMPTGFRLKKVSVDRTHPEVPSYTIIFEGPGNACFAIEMGTEVGDVIVEGRTGKMIEPTSIINNPLLGKTGFWNTREYFGTDWFPPYKNTAYRVRGDWGKTEPLRDKDLDRCNRMNANELITVIKSLSLSD